MSNHSVNFHKDLTVVFVYPVNKQADRQTDRQMNITSLEEVIKDLCKLVEYSGHSMLLSICVVKR